MPTVSVCIPSYNHAAHLPAAIESALGQTYRDLEVVIVDDGSTDDSLEIARAYERREPDRVRVFTHPGHANKGTSATANLACDRARGEFWSGLPSDDLLHLDRVERLLRRFARHPELDVIYSYARYIDETGRPLPQLGLFGVDITRETHPADLLIPGNLIPGMAILARRACFDRVGRHEDSLVYSDWELWVRLFASARIGFVPAVLVDYRVHEANTSVGAERSVHLARHLEVIETLERKVGSVRALARPRLRALLAFEHAYLEFCVGRFDAARDHVREALAREPQLRRSPAPLGPYLVRWEDDELHSRLPSAEYAKLGAILRSAPPNGGATPRAPTSFGQLVLSALGPPHDSPPSDWRHLVAAVQYVSAARQHWHAGERVRAAARGLAAVRTYPPLVTGRSPGSLLSRTVQPRVVRAIGLGRDRSNGPR